MSQRKALSLPFTWTSKRSATKNACFHMQVKVTVEGEGASLSRSDLDRDAFGGLDQNRMLARQKIAGAIFQFHEHAMQMEGVFHHRVVYERPAQPFAVTEVDR